MAVTLTSALKRVAAIERLRVSANAAPPRLTPEQVRMVVDGLKFAYPLERIVESSGLAADAVLLLTGSLGTWLTHVHGGSEATYTFAIDHEQQQLFRPGDEGIVIPLGFERRGDQRRDVARSVAAVITHNPDDTEISRFIDRKYPAAVGVLSGRDVYTVWRVAQLGRIDEMDLVSKSAAYAQVVVAAFDLLDTTITDALNGVAYLTELAESATSAFGSAEDLADLADACIKVSWVNEGRMLRLTNALDRTQASQSDSAFRSLLREVRLFARASATPGGSPPRSIAGLTEGQVQRLVEQAGLGPAVDARKVESTIRQKLIAMGLRNDVDRLLPEAMRAVSAEVEDQFWEALTARQNGDTEWRLILDEALLESVG